MDSDTTNFEKVVPGLAPEQLVFGRFRLKKVLGRGGMGVVWLGWDEKLKEDVALKFLPENIRLDEAAIFDLKMETRKSRQLTHPSMVRIHDFFEDDQTAAISMEYVDGKTLSALRLLKPDRIFQPSELVGWIRQLGAALTYAHNIGKIVHRDLKPANLMINSRGQLRVTDFGIARSLSDSRSRVTMPNMSSGSPPYMSPQQLSGESASASDDIYSLGATLYELLSSKPPFYSGDITYQVLHVTPRPVSAQRSHLSEGKQGFEAIPLQMQAGIARCLEKSPELRPRSAEEAVSEILGESMTTVRVSPVAPLSQVQLTKRKNVALLPAIGVLSLILLLLIGAGLYAFVINSRHAEKSEALPILAEHSPVPTPTPESAAKSEQSGAQDPTLKEALASIGSEDTSPDPSPAASVAAVPTQPLQETPAVQGLISATDDRGTASSDAGPSASAQPVDFNYFHDQLAPFGTWINVNGSMYWHPDQAINSNPDWRPYYDMGQWVQTENGMYWQSDYTWGDIPFHYGRWVQDPNYGWIWSPDYTWGPAWVFWRQSDAYGGAIGWAPLPVGAIFANGILMFNGMAADQNCDFGLGESAFVFVGYNHFHESFFRMRGHEWAYHIPPSQLHGFYKSSFVKNDFHQDGSGRFVNGGIGLNRINQLTHGQVAKSAFEGRTPVGDRNQLAETRSKLITEQHHVPTSVSAENTEHRIAKPLSVERTSESGHEPVRPVSVSKVFRPELPRKSVQQPQVVTTPQAQKKK